MASCYVKFYHDWIEQTAALEYDEIGRLFIAILEYDRSGVEPQLDGRESILFPVFKSVIDRESEKAKTNSENGAKGGRGRKATESETKPNKATESETNGVVIFLGKSMTWSEANEEIAKKEAYDGEYTVEEVEDNAEVVGIWQT